MGWNTNHKLFKERDTPFSASSSGQQPSLLQPNPATKAMTRTASAPAPGRPTRWLPKRAMRPPLKRKATRSRSKLPSKASSEGRC